jgi:hypothetical protein
MFHALKFRELSAVRFQQYYHDHFIMELENRETVAYSNDWDLSVLDHNLEVA